MVATVGLVSDLGYYANGGRGDDAHEAVPNYYTTGTAHGDPPGRWGGPLADRLGISGDVQDGQMEFIMGTFTAPDGTQLGSRPGQWATPEERAERAVARLGPDSLPEERDRVALQAARSAHKARLAVDLTASPAKSFSVAHLSVSRAEAESTRSGDSVGAAYWGERREQLEAAFWKANDAMLDYASAHMVSQAGRHSSQTAGRYVSAEEYLAASFRQSTSRAGDWQQHIHNVIMNRVLCEDGDYRAIDHATVFAEQHAYGAIFQRALAEELADLGIETGVRPDGFREIVGIPQDVLDNQSQRRQQITKGVRPAVEEWKERYGRPPTQKELGALKQQVNFRTREGKSEATANPGLVIARAQERLTAELGRGLLPIATKVDIAMSRDPIRRSTTFSPDAVCKEAVAACALEDTSWNHAKLVAALESRVPLMGMSARDSAEYFDRLATYAAEHYAVPVGGREPIAVPDDLIVGSYVRPSDRRFASPDSLAAEDALRQAAMARGAKAIPAHEATAWLDEHYPHVGGSQRAAIVGMASSDARVCRLIGPAGTGKTYTAGIFSEMWSDLTGGTVHGVTIAEKAARELKDKGVERSMNSDRWLIAQDRAAREGNEAALLGPGDLAMLDESSMLTRDRAKELVDRAIAADARVIFAGDDRQLTSVGAGGVMGLIGDVAETHSLTEVRRFSNEWERAASLRLRDGDVSVLEEYDRRGRIVALSTVEEGVAKAARAAAADQLAGKKALVICDTNDVAAQVSDAIREYFVEAGAVEEDGVILGRTGSIAAAGDQVATRKNNYDLGVLNRDSFTIVGIVQDDGSLTLRDQDGSLTNVPADYVEKHLELAYGSTVHSAQGGTVLGNAYDLCTNPSARTVEAHYVANTRGRDLNLSFVVTGHEKELAPYETHFDLQCSARAILADVLEREGAEKAARVIMAEDDARINSMATIMARLEDGTQAACRARMENHLDRFVEDDVLSMDDRLLLANDESTEHLSRLLRAGEQAGHDPEHLLRHTIEARDFDGARNIAQVLSGRIESEHHIQSSTPADVAPSGLPQEHADYLAAWRAARDDRIRELGIQAGQDAPAWAVKHLGAVPDDPMERLEWEAKAGLAAASREAGTVDSVELALPHHPGVSTTEKRALRAAAYDALGRPEEFGPESQMSEGQLRVRMTAWERAQSWAPPHADASLRDASTRAREAEQEATLAAARGDRVVAEQLAAEAERHAAVARGLTTVAEARSAWMEETAMTHDVARRAEMELSSRGITPGAEPDRITAQEWLAHQRDVDAREDLVREVTELDIPIAGRTQERAEADYDWAREPEQAESSWSAQRRASLSPDDIELEDMVRTACDADNRITDRGSEETVHDEWDFGPDAAPDLDLDVSDVAEAAVPVLSASPFRPWPDED